MDYKEIGVEGFEIHKLLSRCLKEKIQLRNIRILSDKEFVATISYNDWGEFCRITKNTYYVYIINEKGIKQIAYRFSGNRWALFGIVLFLLLVVLQTGFISEIRIYGYEKLTETEVLESLEEAGLYIGGRRPEDLDRLKIEMYKNLDNISWVGITIRGGLAEVTLAEGTRVYEKVEEDQPCHIVAAKEGYVEKTIAREGKEAVKKGDFVNVGDLLISGIIEIEDKTYKKDSEGIEYRYVHSDGEVFAKTVHRFVCYQEAYIIEKDKTGRWIPGLKIGVGKKNFNTANIFTPYGLSEYKEKKIIDILWPFQVNVALNKVYEVEINKRKRTKEEMESLGNLRAREYIKNNLSKSTQILNKGLNFSPEENIIKVIILIEALEEIGKKEKFLPTDNEELGEDAERI